MKQLLRLLETELAEHSPALHDFSFTDRREATNIPSPSTSAAHTADP